MEQQKKTIVALHGAGMSARVWDGLSLALPVQAVTLPGHGGEGGLPLSSIEEMAVWIQARFADLAPQSVILMGHSMGALVALEAARHTSIAGLVLLGAAQLMPVHPDLLRQAAENPDAAADMILKWGLFAAHPHAAEIREKLKEQMRDSAPGALARDLEACNAYRGGAPQNIFCPVLVIAGADDKMTRAAEGRALAEKLPQGKFHILPETGHMMMVEKPLEVAAEINRFLTNLSISSKKE